MRSGSRLKTAGKQSTSQGSFSIQHRTTFVRWNTYPHYRRALISAAHLRVFAGPIFRSPPLVLKPPPGRGSPAIIRVPHGMSYLRSRAVTVKHRLHVPHFINGIDPALTLEGGYLFCGATSSTSRAPSCFQVAQRCRVNNVLWVSRFLITLGQLLSFNTYLPKADVDDSEHPIALTNSPPALWNPLRARGQTPRSDSPFSKISEDSKTESTTTGICSRIVAVDIRDANLMVRLAFDDSATSR